MKKKSNTTREDVRPINLRHIRITVGRSMEALHAAVGQDDTTRQEVRDALRELPHRDRRRVCEDLAVYAGLVAHDAFEVLREMDD